MRRRDVSRLLLACVATGGVLVGSTGVARADWLDDYVVENAAIVCSVLDSYPSVGGVEGVVLGLMDDGLAPASAGEVLARSVIGWCPEHSAEMNAWIAKWSRGRAAVA
ncbi:MAG: DUF732 domain-containing protein [Mycobacterium kyogaense]|uniref:DUF732 domain-containing protein n=1 Tax=Mycobacterium kyogaense TaxID=2212479 RepID=UPI002FF4B84F